MGPPGSCSGREEIVAGLQKWTWIAYRNFAGEVLKDGIDTKAKVEGFKSKRNVNKNKQDIIQIAGSNCNNTHNKN